MIDKLIALVKSGFESVTDTRSKNLSYKMPGLLSLAFAMFHLKDASVSAFRKDFSIRTENLKRVYGVTHLPGDTALRESIDEVNPKELQVLFKAQMDLLKAKDLNSPTLATLKADKNESANKNQPKKVLAEAFSDMF